MHFILNARAAPQRWFALAVGAPVLAGFLALAIAASAAAQTGGEAVYAVTYLDVSTDWIVQGTGLIKQYRDASRGEPGNLEFAILQEPTRPNRFVVVEGWKDQRSMDDHAKGAASHRFEFILKAIRNSPPNQHVLQSFAASAARPAPSGGAVYLVQHIDIAFGGFGPPVQAAIRSFAEASQKEEGALRYNVYEEPVPHANHFSVVAVWANEKAYEAHEAASHTKQFRAAAALTGPGNLYDQRLYKVID
jgi:quinol monooxygenase YgiN